MQTIVTIGIFQAVITVLLFVSGKRKRQGELLLVAGLFFCVLHLLFKTLLLYVYGQLNKGIEISTFFQTIYSLLSYLYALSLAHNKPMPSTDKYLFGCFFCLSFINYCYAMYKGIMVPAVATLYLYNYINYWLFISINLWFIGKIFTQVKSISSYWREEVMMIRQFNLVMTGSLLFFVFVLLINSFPLNTTAVVQTFARFRWVNYSVLLYVALTLVWYRLKIAGDAAKDTKALAEPLPAQNILLKNAVPPAKQEAVLKISINNGQTKTVDEGIHQDGSSVILMRLEVLMKQEKLYKDAELTVEKLSAASGIYKHHISTAINQQGGKPFQVFVNEFRVNEVVEELDRCREKNITPNILELAFEAGFNSKSSFNLNFKKQTGFSPTGYLKNMKGVIPERPQGISFNTVVQDLENVVSSMQ